MKGLGRCWRRIFAWRKSFGRCRSRTSSPMLTNWWFINIIKHVKKYVYAINIIFEYLHALNYIFFKCVYNNNNNIYRSTNSLRTWQTSWTNLARKGTWQLFNASKILRHIWLNFTPFNKQGSIKYGNWITHLYWLLFDM